MNDSGALEKIIDEVIAANPANVEQYRAGKDKAFKEILQNLPICLVAVSHRWHPQHL